MKTTSITAALGLAVLLAGTTAGLAQQQPWDDDTNTRFRGPYERNYDSPYPGRGYGWGRERRFYNETFPGRAYGYRREPQRYWDGNCQVTRFWRDGEYHTVRRCHVPSARWGY